MHVSTPAVGAIAALCCLTLACTSPIGDLFPDLPADGGTEVGSSGGGPGDPSDTPDDASVNGADSTTSVDATSGLDVALPPEGGNDAEPSCRTGTCGEHAHCVQE